MTTSHDSVLTVQSQVEFHLEGEIGRRLKAVTEQWILPATDANPAMLAMFRDRDRKPYRKMVPWAGEFAGKYLTHSVQILRLTGDARLRSHLEQFVKELCACQASDGYLGCWPQESRLTNHAPNCADNWDTWSGYHMMLGLLLWNEVSGDDVALCAAGRIADLLCEMYLDKKTPRLVDTGSTEMNLAPIHSLCLLYKKTGVPRHLALAKQILAEFAVKDAAGKPLAGDYLQAPLSGQEFFQTPKPRWESLHPIMGLVELYYLTGDESCRKAFESLWWSMLKGDRHNNGGFTSGEQAHGDPYHKGAIETCCTVAWMAMSVEMLRLTGCSIIADELELSMLNSGLGMMSPSGRWVTYNTPMDGTRIASPNDSTSFQARPGANELNCCSVNGPRALGILCEWALMCEGNGLVLNYYGQGTMKTSLPSGNTISIKQDTNYPWNAVVDLAISASKAEKFTLALRIPYWSKKTCVNVNGKEMKGVKSGDYLRISREWKTGDAIRIEMDFQLQFWRHPTPDYARHLTKWHDWETEWLLAGPVCNSGNSPDGLPKKDLFLDNATSMADVVRAKNDAAAHVNSTSGHIDFKKVFPGAGSHAAAWCFTEIDAPSDGTLPVLFGCDWWYSCFVNGKMVIQNGSGAKDRQHYVGLSLKAGRNLIGFRITAGSEGWMLTMAKGEFVPKVAELKMPSIINIVSIYRGPVLLAYDARFNDGDYSPENIPHLAEPALKLIPKWKKVPSDNPLLLMEGKDGNGNAVRYCDFASAGATGNYYQSWVPVRFKCPEVEFSRENPRRSSAVDGLTK
ncbi:MAG: beta-L-arabinofuranosidase domain-containing protein [Victivallales bacterium]